MKRMLSMGLLVISSWGFAAGFVAGKDYEVLSATTPTDASQSIEVKEFFSYGCPWCYKLNKPLHEYIGKQGDHATLKQVPVVFHPSWKPYAKAFYVAKRINQLDKIGPALFKAVQKDKQKLDTDQAMVDFFVKQGVDKATAQSAFLHSPTIDEDVKQGNIAMAKYRIRAIPAVVVGNHYKVDLAMAGGPERFFAILDYLIEKQRKS